MSLNGLTSIMQDPNTANQGDLIFKLDQDRACLLYTSPSPRDGW